MTSVEKAIEIVKHHSKPLTKATVKLLEDSEENILAEDIKSPINMPPFRQSAMDGYALCLHENLTYNLIGEIKAGDAHQPTLKAGDAIRIFTGAPVPDSANAVMMQEKVIANGSNITIENHIITGHNIRPLGEQVKIGDIALKKGTKLTPPAIGYLSALGISKVSVIEKPSIAIVTTGNELIKPGKPLAHGKIYESNSIMLKNALNSIGYNDVIVHTVEDHYDKTKSKLEEVISEKNLVIISGGISVGDYDFVGKALNELGTDELFYKVKQKPGKPLFFGKIDETLVFALPGNPAAALTCFYIYVHIALQKMTSNSPIELARIKAKSNSKFIKKGDRPQFLKAIYNEGEVEILEGQSSSMLQTFALSNALVYITEDVSEININDDVDTILLPY